MGSVNICRILQHTIHFLHTYPLMPLNLLLYFNPWYVLLNMWDSFRFIVKGIISIKCQTSKCLFMGKTIATFEKWDYIAADPGFGTVYGKLCDCILGCIKSGIDKTVLSVLTSGVDSNISNLLFDTLKDGRDGSLFTISISGNFGFVTGQSYISWNFIGVQIFWESKTERPTRFVSVDVLYVVIDS